MIAKAAPTGISANNVIPVTITKISQENRDTVDISLCLGHDAVSRPHDTANAQPVLHARITRWSAHRLKLGLGQKVFAVIKSVTVDGQVADHAI